MKQATMTAAELRAHVPEEAFLQHVIQLARHHGWRVYHTQDSRRSEPGFPDLVMVRGSRVLYAECKAETGRLSREQVAWIDALRAAGQEVYVWKPLSWPTIERILDGAEVEGRGEE